MELPAFRAAHHELIVAALKRQLAGVAVPELARAMGHLLGKGKLFRPLLALATYHALGGDDTARQVPLVTPLELIHTFTLIHDDLPCMDDAALRRGVPAVHVAHGEALAVLAGDALLGFALLLLADDAAPELAPALRLKLVSAATRATEAVVEGQVLDLMGEEQELGLEQLKQMHLKKTGALLGACCESGALLAGADDREVAGLRRIGEDIGLAFQIRDDLLSFEGTEDQTGKTLSSDERKRKSTYVRVLGLEGAREHLAGVEGALLAELDALKLPRPGLLREFAAWASQRDS